MLPGQPLHPLKHALQIFTDASKEWWGAHLNERTARGTWKVPPRKQIAHKPFGTKSSLSGPKRVPRPLLQQHSTGSHRQHNSGCLYQQGRGDEVGLTVCPTVENPVLVHQETGNSQSMSHPWPAECDSRQAIQAWPDHSNGMVSSSRGVPSYMLPVASAPSGSFCHQIQQQPQFVSPVPDPQAWAVDALGLSWEDLDPYAFPPAAILGKVVEKLQDYPCNRIILIGGPTCPVLGSSGNVQSDPAVSAQPAKSIFTKWCLSNQVDFRAPPLKAIADFLLHLFQDRKLQPGTLDGYRSAIADKLDNSPINVNKDENLTCLLDSFHRDRPKGRRDIPSWNLSLVLHQLTKAPFKTVCLLALSSGKHRSEIHAWLHKNIRHQSDWSKVSLYPSPSFLSKNQLAKEGPDSVAPVVIPALAPTLDKSLKGDRSSCPVRALRYYLDRTSDLRQNKELVFVSFKKGSDKDISPATISWTKQTVILCYELSDQEDL